MTMPRPLLLLLGFGAVAPASASGIDPAIYASIFEINKPTWILMSEELQKLRLPDGAKVLDVGAGPGEPTTTILTQQPALDVTCTDPQEAMVSKARERTKKKLPEKARSSIQFAVAKAELLADSFAESSFDALTACFVLMFVDVPTALTEMSRVLKPGGHALFAVWDKMPFFQVNTDIVGEMWADFVRDAARKNDPPSLPVNPMALSRTAYNTKGDVAALAREASFKVVRVKNVAYPFALGSLDALCDASRILTNGVMPALAEASGNTEASLHAEHCERLRKELEGKQKSWKQPDGTWHFGVGEARIFTVQKPEDAGEVQTGEL